MAWFLLGLAIIFNSAGNVLIKRFSSQPHDASLLGYLDANFILGLACFGANVLIYAKALEKLPIETAYPILVGLSLLLVSAAALLVFHARFGLWHAIGMAMILGGATILVRVTNMGG